MSQKLIFRYLMALLGWFIVLTGSAWGEEPQTGQPSVPPELQAVYAKVQAAQQPGPRDIPLRDQAVLKLPQGYIFIPTPAASEYMRAMGSAVGDRFLGMIVPEQDDANWVVVMEYVDAGYIKDDEAKTWNVDELLNSYRQGTEEANKDRAERGFPQLEVTGWVEKPDYDETSRRLVWSMSVKHKGAQESDGQSVNYNTYALGRDGYISLNLVTDLKAINRLKPVATELLAALQYNAGKSYADFNESTDKVAEYGLAALVGGVVAKKLGLLALGAAFFAKFAKIILVALAAFGTIIGKLLGRKKSDKT